MRALIVSLFAFSCFAQTDLTISKARLFEKDGDGIAAANLLQSAAAESDDPKLLTEYAEFLDRHHQPEARHAYERLLARLERGNDKATVSGVAHRLVVLDLLAGDRAAAQRHLALVSNRNLLLPSVNSAEQNQSSIQIPGPLRSFARMAALAPDLAPDSVLTALARNIVTNGYQAANSAEGLEPTEYLKLVMRYLSQARELEKMAGDNKHLRVETCESTQAADLLRLLGYRVRGGCGSDLVLETVNATRAFVTIDSGFPLAELEQSLRANRPFDYDLTPTTIPVLYSEDYWVSKDKGSFVDQFIGDPALCRLYLGFSRLDDETAAVLRKAIPAQRLKAFAHVLDFYGGMFEIRNGHAVVPGGQASAAAWKEVVGKPPEDGAAFFERLLTRDDGWMASYYDALARMTGPARAYMLDPKRMQRFYTAVRGKVTSPGPARPVFRANTDMLLLTQNLYLDPNGSPHVPGNLTVWYGILSKHPHSRSEMKQVKAGSWKDSDDFLDVLFAITRRQVENEPLRLYLVLCDLDRYRPVKLKPATVERLAGDFREFGAQYAIFNEVPTVSDETMIAFLDAAQAISKVHDNLLRADTAGTFQGLVGLWQILCRQESIPSDQADATLAGIVKPFLAPGKSPELFDAGRNGLNLLLAAAQAPKDASPQDALLDLLAGTPMSADAGAHQQVMQDMMRLFEAQKLISLKSIFDVADHLEALSKGEKLNPALVNRFASKIAEIQLPRASLSAIEKNTLSFGYWTEKHVEWQRKVNLRAVIDKSMSKPERLLELRGILAPFLRDTIVGFNYIHYAPPGAQVLQTNPLFVRMHDFIGLQSTRQTWKSTEIYGTGWPSNAGGRLVGSLVSVPYALAEAEQNFLVPSREQALIWGDLVPQLLISAKVPTWWNVTPEQLTWVSIHMNKGESLLAESAIDPHIREQVLGLLAGYAPPARLRKVEREVSEARVREAIQDVTPSEFYQLADAWWSAHKDDSGLLSAQMQRIRNDFPNQVKPEIISRAFGTPKPTLSHSYVPQLLHMRTMPTLMGYSSRIMAESWESNNLYYAALADELHMRPSQLNVMVPQWTQETVEHIFATHLEDWPALLRSLRLVGDDARARLRASMREQKASLN